MDNNFLTNGGKNKFFTEEVDDDEFLRHPKSGSSGYMLPHQVSGTSVVCTVCGD